MSETFLDRVYDKANPEETRALYDAWAPTYDTEIAQNGYATPTRIAKALAAHVTQKDAPILDFGCGTGLSGLALRSQGFDLIDGMDPSDDMLARARQKNAYRRLTRIAPTDTTPIEEGAYKTIAAIGVIGTGAAPASTFDILLRALPRGGLLGVSLNDHAIAAKVYEATMCNWLDSGAARLLFKEYGPHLPGQNIKSNVYIIEKA
jgi:predicted TPR repeat methyltransferase